MGKLKITDLVDDKALETLKTLDKTISNVRDNYSEAAKELAGGLDFKVNNLGDLEKFNKLVNDNVKKANDATEKLKDAVSKQKEELDKTKKSIEEEYDALRRENEEKKKSIKLEEDSVKMARQVLGTRKENLMAVAKLDKALANLREAQKTLTAAEKAGTISTEEAIKRKAELLDKERTLKNEKAELQKTMAIEEKMTRAAAGTYENASQKLELLKRAYKRMSDDMKETSIGKQMANDIKELDEKLKENAADMGEFQRNVGNYQSAITDKLRDVLGISEDTGNSLLALGQKGGAGFSALSVKVQAFGKALLTLLANPAVLAVLGIAGTAMAFKWIYDYNVGLAQATKLTQQFTGATGDMLKNQRNEVQALADMYGKDFQEVLISTNALAKQFGISFDEAFAHVKDGFVSGADVTGEFLDNVKEYPAYFKEAGISASQFVAITTQANKQGIYSDKGIDVIKEGNLRIREMTQATRDALEGIGISSEQVLKDLESGEKTTFDVMQMVSAKLEEFPESSAAVGTALADIFGGPGEDAGLQYIKTLKDIETNMDTVKAKAGRMAQLQEEQLQSEIELQNTLSSLFDFTGGTFEEMTTSVKVFVNNGISAMIRGLIDVVNYFIELYNESVLFRGMWQGIVVHFKTGFDTIGNILNLFVDVIKATGKMLKGAFTLDWDEFKQGLADYAESFPKLVKAQVKDMKENFKEGIEDMQKKIEPITVPVKVVMPNNKNANKVNNMKKGINAIRKGDKGTIDKLSSTTSTTTSLGDAFNEETERANINNRLAIVEEGSEEELALRLRMLEIERDAELLNTIKTGADKQAIIDKYLKLEQEAIEQNSATRVANLQEQYATENVMADVRYAKELASLNKSYADGLISAEEYEQKKYDLGVEYSQESARRAIAMLEEQLSVENLSAEDREKIEMDLAKAKADYESQIAEDMIDATERQKRADRELANERIENIGKYMSYASEALNTINGLSNAIFESKNARLDEESERAQADYDAEMQRIEELAEKGAISKEEAESRKQAAEKRTADKEKEIEKERQKLKHKQAIWNKANQLAQTGIATARGIMEALAALNPGLATFIGIMGGIQAATIIATPIPQYANGTGNHPGGLALVGDGGKQELVVFDGKAFVTSDEPTLVNLPKGAEVYPDANAFNATEILSQVKLVPSGDSPIVMVNNDFKELERKNALTNDLLRQIIKLKKWIANKSDFENYKNSIL